MKIKDIYKKFYVSRNLQEHMLRVAGVAQFVAENWNGPELDINNLLPVALVHDIGNTVKYDFDKYRSFLKTDKLDLEELKVFQKKLIQKYGPDDNIATSNMLKELGVPGDIIKHIYSKRFINSPTIEKSEDWNLKILAYSDLRALPQGIGSLQERLDEIHRRYDYKLREDYSVILKSINNIEKQIQNNVTVSLNAITDKTIKIDEDYMLNMEIGAR